MQRLSICILLLVASLFRSVEEPKLQLPESVRGITVSTPYSGQDWASDEMVETLKDVRTVGGNWVTIHPYASISDGNGRHGHGEGYVSMPKNLDLEKPPESIARPIREAQALGLKILIKPHLAYWGTRYSWRGDIKFDSREATQRFFESYRAWIVRIAELCRDADAFVIGTELDHTLKNEFEWRQIIAEIREVNSTPLTYAANWDGYMKVPFWDGLDAIGVQAYFPLTEEPTADEELIREGWRSVMSDLHRYATRQNRNIVFTELGYTSSRRAAVQPWSYQTEKTPEAGSTQETCLRIAFESIAAEPRVAGGFLWKWFPDEKREPRDFDLRQPRLLKVIQEAWKP